jgi:bifunctional UDP-N-acetylglucosamine pyrophosphorylase / glucosamine-1-phosphate N-acetyltransferase
MKKACIILAAGKGTRMKSDLTKVLHPIAGRPMLHYPLQTAREIGCEPIFVVIGHQRADVEQAIAAEDITFVLQEQQLGSGHAVAVCRDALAGFDGDVLILCGDVPFITAATLNYFISEHAQAEAVVSVLSVPLDNPHGYGRIVRGSQGELHAIVEHRDATPPQLLINEINTGIYCCSASFLFKALRRINTDNEQGEYYLPDIIAIGRDDGLNVQAIATESPHEVEGINDRAALARAEQRMQTLIQQRHMLAGVSILQPSSTFIDERVSIGREVILEPGAVLRGATVIGSGCTIGAGSVLINTTLGNTSYIGPCCVIENTDIPDGTCINPCKHMRSGIREAQSGT